MAANGRPEPAATNGNTPGPLKILIVGAGLGGLAAGIGLRQAGHNVTIFEGSRFSNETGAAIHIAPNCTGLLKRMGLHIEDVGANEIKGMHRMTAGGDDIFREELTKQNSIWQHKWLLVHRAHLHTAMKNKATGTEGAGKPCDLRLASRVASIDPEHAVVKLSSGEEIQGDVVIGADGSITRNFLGLPNNEYQPYDAGHSAFRWLVPMSDLEKDPDTKKLIGHEGEMTMIFGSDRRCVYYPCVRYTVMNCLMIHPSRESRSDGQDWNQKGDRQQLLKIADEYTPEVKKFLSMAPEDSLKVWTFLDLKVLPHWVNGRLVVLGDAAHPFLPHLAQGGAQAIEDAVSLAAVLPLGTKREKINERLELYQRCRKGRADFIQQSTRTAGLPPEEQKKMGFVYNPLSFNSYNLDWDEWDHSRHELNKLLWSKKQSHLAQPTSFGPLPTPFQFQSQFIATPDRRTLHTVRFLSSKTFLRTLLPNDCFSYFTPGSLAQASLICSHTPKAAWLGGRPLTTLGLYLHGVQYKKKDATVVQGSFLPVIFSDSAEETLVSREFGGAPGLPTNIDIETGGKSKIRLSWGKERTVLAEISMSTPTTGQVAGRDVETLPRPQPDEGTLTYRYVPAVGEPGKADAEYAVFEPYASVPAVNGHVDGALGGKAAMTAEIRFFAGDRESLPMLHQVARSLAEMPIYRVLEARSDEVEDGKDGSRARRVE